MYLVVIYFARLIRYCEGLNYFLYSKIKKIAIDTLIQNNQLCIFDVLEIVGKFHNMPNEVLD